MIQPRVYVAAFYLALKYGSPFLFGWAVISWRRYLRRRKHEAAQGWSSVEGVILSGEVKRIPKTTQFQATLTYSYYVGEYRAGKYELEFSKEADADEFARSVKDRRLQVRYKPSNPDVSILDESAIAQLSPVKMHF